MRSTPPSSNADGIASDPMFTRTTRPAPSCVLYFVVQPRHVYVHVPFCARRCAYCDFSIAVRRVVPVEEFVNALDRELALRFTDTAHWTIDTLYLGGGTPSRLGAEGVARTIALFQERASLAADAEVTIEANPEDISADAIAAWRAAGVNRLSIGAQSFDDQVLAWMHRTHDASAIARAVATARDGGVDNVSIDLIFALPPEVERSWERDVSLALELEPSHLSLYGLTIEPRTPLGRWQSRGGVTEAPDDRYEVEFLHAHDVMTAAGFEHYEVSNFGLPARQSRHNSSYWNEAPYAGLGPSAHEFDGHRRRWNAPAYADWLRKVGAGRDPVEQSEELSVDNRTAERVYLGLRTTTGLALRETELDRARTWINAGWATMADGRHIRLTPLGWLRLDALAADLTHVRSRY
jgi:oxygen-independent coproporphyrinogen-3 oxidase